MAALTTIGACAAALPGVVRATWDLRWLRALQRHRDGGSSAPSISGQPGCTLILCAHNDLAALQANWPAWRGQRFPDHWQTEWLVVDDGSTDGTGAWLEAQVRQDERLTVIRHSKVRPGKKDALSAGIRSARFERLVLTDADCRPEPGWAHAMARALGPDLPQEGQQTDVVLGTCLPQGGPPLLYFDALRVALQYAGEAASGRPYMGVGRSIAYRKAAWEKVGGFQGHADLPSGDDDLFVQDILKHGLTVELAPAPGADEGTSTLPARDLADGWNRKRRHLGTASRYATRDRMRLMADAALDPMALVGAVGGASGLFHSAGWIPLGALGLAFAVRSTTLSVFSRTWDSAGRAGLLYNLWGPMRWAMLASATLVNAFTSSPKWTQRAPTSRS